MPQSVRCFPGFPDSPLLITVRAGPQHAGALHPERFSAIITEIPYRRSAIRTRCPVTGELRDRLSENPIFKAVKGQEPLRTFRSRQRYIYERRRNFSSRRPRNTKRLFYQSYPIRA
jgi:hypothetical protein